MSNIGRRISKNSSNSYGWIRDLKRGEVKFNKPVVLCLAGDATQDDISANGMAKEAEDILGRNGITDNDIQILSVQYPKKKLYANQFSMERRSFAEQFNNDSDEIKNPQYIKDIYSILFQPLIINAKGQRFSFSEAQSKFRNLTIFAHCHGTFVSCKLMSYLREEMKKYGYNEDEINLLMGEIVNIGLSPRVGFHRNDGSLKFGFTMLDDAIASYLYPILTENSGKNCVISTLGLGLIEHENANMYFSGDNLNYTDIDNDTFCLLDTTFMHCVNCYTDDEFYYTTETKRTLNKNNVGKNISHLIVRSLQNAVSLSKQNVKRTVENIISNQTPITFKQGSKELNSKFLNVKFTGNNASFKKTLDDYTKQAKEKRFEKAENKIKDKEVAEILKTSITKSIEK